LQRPADFGLRTLQDGSTGGGLFGLLAARLRQPVFFIGYPAGGVGGGTIRFGAYAVLLDGRQRGLFALSHQLQRGRGPRPGGGERSLLDALLLENPPAGLVAGGFLGGLPTRRVSEDLVYLPAEVVEEVAEGPREAFERGVAPLLGLIVRIALAWLLARLSLALQLLLKLHLDLACTYLCGRFRGQLLNGNLQASVEELVGEVDVQLGDLAAALNRLRDSLLQARQGLVGLVVDARQLGGCLHQALRLLGAELIAAAQLFGLGDRFLHAAQAEVLRGRERIGELARLGG
jgi:hypothetical protein